MREVYTTCPRARQAQHAALRANPFVWCYGPFPVRTLTSIVLIVTAALAGTGCVVVKPYQRENLAKRSMTNDREAGEARFQAHARGSREGAEGGTGQPGGGCGCN